jgi:GNAT superfamily N-acetyltransferase
VAKTVEIRRLARDDDRAGFSCGQSDLDRFFEHYAGQNQFKLHLSVTYVAVLASRIVGFATVAASSIERAGLPSARLRKRLPAYPLPVLRLARLGVDTRAQGLGIGQALLRHVLGLAVEQRDRIG